MKSLLHLASEQTMPNLLALYNDLEPEFFDIQINAESPDVDDSRRKVGEALSLWPGAVVNLTCGTKPMSIGAYLAAD